MANRVISRRGVIVGMALASGALLFGGTPRALAESLSKIKDSGVLRIGIEATYLPFSYHEGGQIIGYDIDLGTTIANSLGVKPEFIDTQHVGLLISLLSGRTDILMSSFSYQKEQAGKVGWSIPYTEASQALLIRAADADKIKSIADLSGKVLGVKLGSPGDVMKTGLSADLTAAGHADFSGIKVYDDHPAAYLALSQGSVDGVLNTISTLGRVMKDRPGAYAMIRGIGRPNWAGIVTRKEDVDLVEFLDEEIRRLKANGEIYKMQEKWFGFKMDLADKAPTFS